MQQEIVSVGITCLQDRLLHLALHQLQSVTRPDLGNCKAQSGGDHIVVSPYGIAS